MNGKQLKNSILQWAIQGKLVPQDPNDEPASVLLDKIRQEKERLIKEKKIKRDKNASIIYRGEDNSYYEKIHATGEVKCIDEEIPFEIPQGWEWCRLNDLALYRKGPFGSSLTKSMFVAKSNQSVKVYEQKNAIQKDFRLGDYYISKEKFEAMQSFIVKPNDIIVSCAGTIGETYLLPLDAPVGIINQALMRVTLFDLSIAEYWQMYFAYMLLNEAQMKGAGSAIKNIPPFEYLKAVLVPVPPLSEQNRLVERYNLLLSLIAKYESEADKLNCLNLNIYDKLKKTVLQEAIQGKLVPQIAEEGTAQELLDQIKTEKQKLVKEGKLKKSALNDSVIFRGDDNKYYEQIGKKCLDITEQIPFEIPSNWEWCRVRNVSNSYIGLTYKPTDIDEKGTIVLRSCNIRNGKLALDDIVRVSSSISEKLLIEENDIIICARNGSKRLVGKSALIRNLSEPMTFGAFMAICKTPIYEYMFAYLQSDLFFGQLRDVSNTTTINQLTQNKFNDFLIPIPPIREQERIAFKISQLFQKLR
ncbi:MULTISPECIES: restriction endonuclease subunit S [Bacteroidaceae]|uniref:Restriction endonuclease subunit S n=2 Tax=Bacteroidaceae TaxID=815 RepID=A0AAW4USW4_PHOVU|nr:MULTISPECIES: restriction endonuclease subunit S [Bacteroidaceae]MBV4404436.1 restriction endonuclease subunit S [Phocaeicola vulgatus]MCB6273942.1 restriction endonuclease subunit S [Phocaeicola vulgatus]MCB6290801.1 restriction endonuclease subunit S [Phocaeicola vulgatus]MCB6324444.1 restriction endonuclease subunit S [Phocaeicola vulgatus]MCB6448149.1 restriction endonuclease subunit S [Phocaeicola vulgatus]